MSEPTPFRYVTDWQNLDDDDAQAIREFWLREHANVAGAEAERRVQQTIARVLDAEGELVAVSTAEPKVIPRLMQPMYYYRCFVGAAWRDRKLARPLLRHSFDALEAWAREHDFPCIGMLLELENAGFARTLQRARWESVDFSFIGRSRRGLDLRVRYFRGAKLKTRAEVAAGVGRSTAGRAIV
ncbi:MAG TPA: hypothetical protein VFL63_13725 [Rhodanobacteraceae bacterium]|nr:hypothetical protein [Rhodanobacteraceae bacterium]